MPSPAIFLQFQNYAVTLPNRTNQMEMGDTGGGDDNTDMDVSMERLASEAQEVSDRLTMAE